ncbi:hypothetical protein OUZ56_014446 [Daphnia magna]|uniref:Uncharacterized protein n=1 Tax=Daphnia magna TaxID=35525 RepID=A0ABR0AJV0_9CRUS|nr:hypothetical protein OUZ56_014446 [Daphnia magna]
MEDDSDKKVQGNILKHPLHFLSETCLVPPSLYRLTRHFHRPEWNKEKCVDFRLTFWVKTSTTNPRESVTTIGQQLVDVFRLIGQRQVDDLQQLLGMVKIEDFAGTIERLVQEIHQDLRHPVEEFPRLRFAIPSQW